MRYTNKHTPVDDLRELTDNLRVNSHGTALMTSVLHKMPINSFFVDTHCAGFIAVYRPGAQPSVASQRIHDRLTDAQRYRKTLCGGIPKKRVFEMAEIIDSLGHSPELDDDALVLVIEITCECDIQSSSLLMDALTPEVVLQLAELIPVDRRVAIDELVNVEQGRIDAAAAAERERHERRTAEEQAERERHEATVRQQIRERYDATRNTEVD